MTVPQIIALLYEKSLAAGKRRSALETEKQQVPISGLYCRECGQFHEMCVVRDDLWKYIAGKQKLDIVLCVPCMEKRLGRKLVLTDLKHVPCNAPYFIGFQMKEY